MTTRPTGPPTAPVHAAASTSDAKTPRWVGWYQVVVGGSILGLWALLLLRAQVPEIEAGERGIWFHLLAEAFVSVALLSGGALWLLRRTTAAGVSALALGALLYTTVASAGYYADKDSGAIVGMFAALALLTTPVAVVAVRATTRGRVSGHTPKNVSAGAR